MNSIRFTALATLVWGISICAAADDRKPILSETPLTTAQLQIYQVFLNSDTNGSRSDHIRLSNQTAPLDLTDEKKRGGCLDELEFEESVHPEWIFHKFDPQTTFPANVELVDPKKQSATVRKNDPSRTIKQGKPVDDAVQDAFATGLLTVSEIAFDSTHEYAVMRFSFVCGMLCGHGETLVFRYVDGQWKHANKRCSRWIS